MAIARRQYATGGASSATSVTCDKPTGTVDGDILIARVYLEDTDDAITPPGSWTLIRTDNTLDHDPDGLYPFRMLHYWKRASSEGSSYTWSWTSNVWSHIVIASYSGCLASGDVIDDQDGAIDTSPATATQYYTAPSLTTTVANTMLVYACETVLYGSVTAASGMSEWVFFDAGHLADEACSATGATGTRAAYRSVAGGVDMAMAMFALKPASESSPEPSALYVRRRW